MPRKYSFFLSGRLAVQHDDVWTERIANMNKESSSRLERGWGAKALDLKPTSTWRLKVTLETSGEQHMKKLTFKQLPLIVKIGLGIVFYNPWWSIEEFVIDRHELSKYMPYYKVGDPCVWDLTVAVIITVALCWASAERKSPSSMADLGTQR